MYYELGQKKKRKKEDVLSSWLTGRTPLCCWWRMWLAEWVNREHISKRPFSSPASEPHCFMYWAVCHGGDGETKKRKKNNKKNETPPLSSTSWDVKLLLTAQPKPNKWEQSDHFLTFAARFPNLRTVFDRCLLSTNQQASLSTSGDMLENINRKGRVERAIIWYRPITFCRRKTLPANLRES